MSIHITGSKIKKQKFLLIFSSKIEYQLVADLSAGKAD